MKAPVLHAVREPIVVEEVALDEPRAGNCGRRRWLPS
jgi:hypothetical protein